MLLKEQVAIKTTINYKQRHLHYDYPSVSTFAEVVFQLN